MKSQAFVSRKGDTLIVNTKKYCLFSRARTWSQQSNLSTVTLDGRVYRIAFDGSILANVKGKWVEVV